MLEKVMAFCRRFSALVMMLSGPHARDENLRLKPLYARGEDKKELMRTKQDCTRLKTMSGITYLKRKKRVRVAERKLSELHHWFQTLRQIEPGGRAMRSKSGLCNTCKNCSVLVEEKY